MEWCHGMEPWSGVLKLSFWSGKRSDLEFFVAKPFFITNPHVTDIIRILTSRIQGNS